MCEFGVHHAVSIMREFGIHYAILGESPGGLGAEPPSEDTFSPNYCYFHFQDFQIFPSLKLAGNCKLKIEIDERRLEEVGGSGGSP